MHESVPEGHELALHPAVSEGDRCVSASLKRIENADWLTLTAAIHDVRDSFEFLMVITRDMYELGDSGNDDALDGIYEVAAELAVQLPLQQRLAHVARLVRTTAESYGLRTDRGLGNEAALESRGDLRPNSAAWILDQLAREARSMRE